MGIAYTNHIGHSARHKHSGKSTVISTIKDLVATEKHNNHDYTIDDVSHMQSRINLDMKKENNQYEMKTGKIVKIEGRLNIEANVRKIYEEQFTEAVTLYNEKQIEAGHPERQITSYIVKVSEDKQQDYAVISLQNGDDIKTVQENLGHHSAAFILDSYAHVTNKMRYESAKRRNTFVEKMQRQSVS